MSRSIADGPSPDIRYPAAGPYDLRLGYAGLPDFLPSLQQRGWVIAQQARPSTALRAWIDATGHALYVEKSAAGITLLDRHGDTLYQARFPGRTFEDPSEVPQLLTRTLLQIEDQHLLDPQRPYRNPAVDWPRFLLAAARRIVHLGGSHAGGASTLATQIEKFRHSPEGRTESAGEKLRQMATASLRAYAQGRDTTVARQQFVATYLDAVPLASRAGYGEVIGLGDGLWVWYGMELKNVLGPLSAPPQQAGGLSLRAEAYKHALSLLLAERRPSYYLVRHPGRLEGLTNRYLRLLMDQRVIPADLAEAALKVPLHFRAQAPAPPVPRFAERKGADALRAELLEQLHLRGLGELDRLDLTAKSTLDHQAQEEVTEVLRRLADPVYAKEQGLMGRELLPQKGLDQVVYSVLLYERTPAGNELRMHADSLDEPFDINTGAKLILGSTAKLRTLITYLDIVAQLHDRLAALTGPQRTAAAADADDPLSRWAADYLNHKVGASLENMLEAALQRRYSASPGQRFFTGGGEHVFHNFKRFEDAERPTVEDAFERSINLAFIRLMRDITSYYIGQQGDVVKRLLSNKNDPARQEFLRRFADQEGRGYLGRFYEDYRGLSPGNALEQLADRSSQTPRGLAAILLAVRPEASKEELMQFLRGRIAPAALERARPNKLYEQCEPGRLTLQDRGYLAHLHPLEIWLVAYLRTHPDASRSDVLRAGAEARRQAYAWLMHTHHPARQDERIQILLEQMAFDRIADDWHRQGYPFEHLVPSLATAIGSSGDRPDALAELLGIVSAGGVRLPAVDLTAIQFAPDTPYETRLVRRPPQSERVLDPRIAVLLRRCLEGVVERGTAQRLKGAFLRDDGTPLELGGKTGTGDNRLESFAAGGRLMASKAVSRSATFAFFLGERYFGVVTAYVPGGGAAHFAFTSALAVQLLHTLAPALSPLMPGVRFGAAAAPSDPRGAPD